MRAILFYLQSSIGTFKYQVFLLKQTWAIKNILLSKWLHINICGVDSMTAWLPYLGSHILHATSVLSKQQKAESAWASQHQDYDSLSPELGWRWSLLVTFLVKFTLMKSLPQPIFQECHLSQFSQIKIWLQFLVNILIAINTIKTLIFFVNLGGVICFWGGIIFLGMLFMFALMTKNYLMKNCYKNKYDEWQNK